MPPLLHIVVGNAVVATALAALIAIIASIARRPALTHVLWLLVLLKLLIPGIIRLPISWTHTDDARSSSTSDSTAPAQLTESSAPAKNAVPTSEPDEGITVLIYPADADSVSSGTSSGSIGETVSTLPTSFSQTLSTDSWQTLPARLSIFWPWIAAVWLAGSLLWLAWTMVHVCRFQRLLSHARLAPTDLQDQVKGWSGRLGVKPPALWLVPGCVSPMLWTLGRSPRLLFPAKLLDRLDADQRSALLVHELAHLRRRDHWVRFLEMTVMAVYWWHPVVWWARRELHEAEEQCCDAWVIWALASAGQGWHALNEGKGVGDAPFISTPVEDSGRATQARRAYALALLHTVDFFSHARPTLPAPASGIGQVSHLRRRLTMIMNGNTSKSLSAAGWLAVLTLGLLLPLVPVNAQPQSPSPQDDRRDPRDQQIETLKKVIQALEQQNQALEQVKCAEQVKHIDAKKLSDLQQERARQEMAQAEEQRARAVRFLQEELLAQTQDPEQRRARIHFNVDDKASPEVRKAMQAVEEITKMMEAKRREIQGLEQKLRQAQADLAKLSSEHAPREGREEIRLRTRGDAEIHREPIIIKVDPSTNPEEIRMQVERIQGTLKQPIHVEIVKPEKGPIRNRPEPAPEARPRERRESRPDDLEQKLERIMKEVEELRRELRGSRQ